MSYYAVEPLAKKIRKHFEKGEVHRAYITGEALFPLRFSLQVPKEREIRDDFGRIERASAQIQKAFPCELKTFQFAAIGVQRLPTAVVFDTREVLLAYLNETESFGRFIVLCDAITGEFPSLQSLFERKPLLIMEYEAAWEPLLAVCRFFLAHSRPGCYVRQMGIEGVDTKFVEHYKRVLDLLLSHLLSPENYGAGVMTLGGNGFEKKYGLKYEQPLIRFRLPNSDNDCRIEDLAVPLDSFAALEITCEKVLIVENKITMLSLPVLRGTMIIFGSGYGVQNLKDVRWLKEKNIVYWGDIDTHGLAILSQLRHYYPQTQSMMMDQVTMERFLRLCTRETSAARRELPGLIAQERALYAALIQNRYGEHSRLEQERIPFGYVIQELEKRFDILQNKEHA